MSALPVPCSVAALLLGIALAGPAGAAESDIGAALAITTRVSGTTAGETRVLARGDTVFQDEMIETDAKGVGQFEFRDGTKLAVGPGSSVTLDRFVYDPDAAAGSVVIGLAKGSFRFMTGRSDHDAYEIVTPVATIGVRGTAFDLYVAEDGEMAVAMIEGSVEVCPRAAACRLHDAVGRFLHLTRDGILSIRDRWDGTFLAGVAFADALPFLARPSTLRPAFRTTRTVLRSYGEAATDAAGDAARRIRDALPQPRLPQPRLPRLLR